MSEAAPAKGGLSPGLAAWLVAAAIAAFGAFIAAVAFQPDLGAASDPGAHALSRSPAGYAGVIRLLRADGAQVRLNRRRDPGGSVGPGGLLVLTPRAATTASDILRLARGRRVLLAPPKWETAPDPHRPGRVAAVGLVPDALVLRQVAALASPGSRPPPERLSLQTRPRAGPVRVIPVDAQGRPAGPSLTLSEVKALRTLGGSALKPVVVDEDGRMLVASTPAPASYVLADPELIDNAAIKDLGSARGAVSMLEALADGGPVVFDLTLAGIAGGRNPLKSAFEPPFVAATVSFALAVVLLGLSARARFGPVRPAGRAYGFGKRALADSAASLLAVGGREPRLAPRYAELARDAARTAAGLPPGASPAAEVDALDRLGRARGVGAWSELAADAKAVRTRPQLMALARRTDAWRTEMTRGRG